MMFFHAALGDNDAERRRALASLIRSRQITLGGYAGGKIYGLLSCRSGKRMKVSNRVFFGDEAEALACGYRPCAVCLPALYRRWKERKFRVL